MHTSLVLTLVGPDKPGLVSALSTVIKQHDANWLESHLARLAGQFAGIVHIQADDSVVAALRSDLLALESKGLAVHVAPASPGVAAIAADGPSLQLDLLGHDRPGIVRDITRALAGHRINITELETSTFSAPMSGEPMFKAVATLAAPPDANLDELRDTLDAVAAELDLDLHLNARVGA